MDVRSYEAFTIQDAVKAVKKDLGKDAIILATREKEKIIPETQKKVKIVEVLAAPPLLNKSIDKNAAEQTSQNKNEAPVHSPSLQGTKPHIAPAIFPKLHDTTSVNIIRGSQNIAESNKPKENKGKTTSQPIASSTSNDVVAKNIEEILAIKEELMHLKKELETLPHVHVGYEMAEIKVLLHDLIKHKQVEYIKKYPEYLMNIFIRLRAAGVLESVLTDIMDYVVSLPVPKDPSGHEIAGEALREFYLNSLVRHMFKQISVTGGFKKPEITPHIICFVGPTGVGKTTTIAKLASLFKLEYKAEISLVSMDTFRIAGSDQLRVYARILDCPFIELHDVSEMHKVIKQCHKSDYILIDTAGRSARNLAQMQNLQSLRDVSVPIHFHLVLSATMKQRDIDENIRAFRFLSLESIIFTKIDESWNYGEIFNTISRSKIPLSYFATGQKVPEDIEVATKNQIIERLFQF